MYSVIPLILLTLRISYSGTHEWKKFVTPEELQVMVEGALLDSNHADRTSTFMKLVKHNGIVIKPVNPFNKFGKVVEWGLSETDVDVNYISHFVKLQ